MNEMDFEYICNFINERANKKDEMNRKGICKMEVCGFVHGLKWCVMFLKSYRQYKKLWKGDNNE